MKERVQLWWGGRTKREQWLIAAMLALALPMLLWPVLLRPLESAAAGARERLAAAAAGQAAARARIEAVRHADAARPPFAGSVAPFVARSVADAGFPIASLEETGGGGVRLHLAAVRAQAFFPWLGGLEAEGLRVERLEVGTNDDRTLAVQTTIGSGSR